MTTLKKTFTLAIALLCAVNIYAQREKKFDPAKFEMELEQFIVVHAGLSPEESSTFFPLYREMRKKQREFFGGDRRFRHFDFTDDKLCAEAIRSHDSNEIDMKRLQQEYHEKFMLILPASKVFKIIRAEEQFHRRTFENVAKKFNPDRKRDNKHR